MIENLNGIHETVNYKDGANIRLYENDEFEEYPKHWHTCIEIIMPTAGPYRMTIDGIPYDLKVGDIIVICPGALHHLMACPGERLIFQAELVAPLPLKSIEMFLSLIYPAVLITPENSPAIYQDIHKRMLDIHREYKLAPPLYEAEIYAMVLEMIVRIRRDRSDLQKIHKDMRLHRGALLRRPHSGGSCRNDRFQQISLYAAVQTVYQCFIL